MLDIGSSMRIWHRTAMELRTLFTQLGAFRSMHTWHLETSVGGGTPRLLAPGRGASRHHKELLNPGGERLIVIVSDCLSPAWHDETLILWLRDWGRAHPVGLLQVLPDQRLWNRGALGAASRWAVSAPAPAVPNARLRKRPLSHHAPFKQSDPAGKARIEMPPLPMSPLEPGRLADWASLVTGVSPIRVSGYALRPGATPRDQAAPTEDDWRGRHRDFRAESTPTARRLASLLAAAPLSLPVIRLIQAALVPESGQTHLAELFMSGLLRRTDVPDSTGPPLAFSPGENPERIQYDFLSPELRQQLLMDGRIDDIVEVLARLCLRPTSRGGGPG